MLRSLAGRALWLAHSNLVKILGARMTGRFRVEDALLFTGSPRSGTTWLGELFRTIQRSTMLFEPLMIRKVPEAAAAGFDMRTYKRCDETWPEGAEFLGRVLSGKFVNPWILSDLRSMRSAMFARTLIVKSVRANRLLPWIVHNFAIRKPVLVLRHPCAVVSSQLAYGAWNHPKRPEANSFLADHPRFRTVFEAVETPEEFLALTWAVDNYVPLSSPHADRWLTITYEGLRQDPVTELRPVYQAWGLEAPNDFGRAWRQPSRTTAAGTGVSRLDGWRQKLSPEQIQRILAITGAFGLDCYGEAPTPDLARLRNPEFGRHLREWSPVQD